MIKNLLSQLFIFNFAFCVLHSANAATNTADSASLADVQTAVNASSDGDTVIIPNGSVTWSGGITTTKQIFIRAENYTATPAGTSGAGTSSRSVTIQNNSSTPLFQFTSGNSYHVGVAGIRFNEGSGSGAHLWFGGTGTKVPLIADCYFQNKFRQWPSEPCLRFAGNGGVMWNSVMQGTGPIGSVGEGSCVIKWEGAGIRLWNTASTMGMLDVNGTVNVYFEDSTFINTGNMPDIDTNARFVGRRLLYDGSWGETHGYTSGGTGGRHWEYYDSIFRTTTNLRNISARYFWCRQGTGVFADNECRGDNVGYGTPVQLQIGDTQGWAGYPTPKQPGWGHNGTTDVSDPIYIWGQTGSAAYSWNIGVSAWSSLVQLNRDIFVNNGAKPGYVKFTYPHPLRGAGGPDVTAPTISGTNVNSITDTSLVVSWDTSETTTNALDYGTTVAYGTTLTQTESAHVDQSVTGLAASTLYYFRIRSGDAAGNKTTNTLSASTVAVDVTAPTFTAASTNIINITSGGATILGAVNEYSRSGVTWGYTTDTTSGVATNGAATSLSPSVAFNGATAATLVYVRFWISDVAGNTNSVLASFTTATVVEGNQTYYVDQSAGNDNNDGSAGQPWRNSPGMAGAAAYTGTGNLQPGDSVYFDRGDTWAVGNASGGGFTLVGGVRYVGDGWGTGTRAKIGATARCEAGIVRFNGDHSTFETTLAGFEVTGYGTNTASGVDINHAFWQVGMTDALKVVTNCFVHETYGDSSPGVGDYSYGLIVSDNSGDASGWVANVLVVNSVFANPARDNLCMYPGSSGMISNIVFRGNTVYGFASDPNYSEGHGILVKGDVRNSTIELCTVTNVESSAVFIDAPEEGNGHGPTNLTVRTSILQTLDNNGTVRFYGLGTGTVNADIYNNIFLTNSTTGAINFDGVAGTAIARIFNNTFVNTFVSIGNPATATIHFSNNIIHAVSATPLTDSSTKITSHSNNVFYRTGTGTVVAQRGGTTYTSGTLSSYEASGLASNPQFADSAALPTGFIDGIPFPAGLYLQAGSPAIDSGGAVSIGDGLSINGVTRPAGAAWDRGAYEFTTIGNPITGPPINLRIFLNQ